MQLQPVYYGFYGSHLGILSYIMAFVGSRWKPILNFLFIQVNKIDDFIYISNIDVKILSTLVSG